MLKKKVVELNQALPQKVSESTIKRAIAETKKPALKIVPKEPSLVAVKVPWAAPKERQKEVTRAPLRRKPDLKTCTGLEAIRHLHVEKAFEEGADVEAEIEAFTDEMHARERRSVIDAPPTLQ